MINSSEDVSEDVSRAVFKACGVVTELETYRPSLNEIFLAVARPSAAVKG